MFKATLQLVIILCIIKLYKNQMNESILSLKTLFNEKLINLCKKRPSLNNFFKSNYSGYNFNYNTSNTFDYCFDNKTYFYCNYILGVLEYSKSWRMSLLDLANH
jgi:hypothetical protein